MRDAQVVTCFLLRRDPDGERVLLLRRSERVSTYQGRWAGVSGYLEAESPLKQAYREIAEETGLSLDDVRLLARGQQPITMTDESIDTRWTVHLFLFEALKPELVHLDWEHVESRWVRPEELAAMDTVPGLAEGLGSLYPRSEE